MSNKCREKEENISSALPKAGAQQQRARPDDLPLVV
jgi:hypothetical protein